MVGRVPAFQPGGPGSIPGGVRNFNFCPGIGCVSFVCVPSSVVFGGGPDIVLTTHSGRPALVYLPSGRNFDSCDMRKVQSSGYAHVQAAAWDAKSKGDFVCTRKQEHPELPTAQN